MEVLQERRVVFNEEGQGVFHELNLIGQENEVEEDRLELGRVVLTEGLDEEKTHFGDFSRRRHRLIHSEFH